MAALARPIVHPPTITVSIITGIGEEYNRRAWLDDTVYKNWIAGELASSLGQQLSLDSKGISELWEEKDLQSAGIVRLDWCRTDISSQTAHQTYFYVASDSSALNGNKPMLIGKDTLSKEKGLGREDGAFPMTLVEKKLTKEEKKVAEQRRNEYHAEKKRANEGMQARQGGVESFGGAQYSTSAQPSSSAAGGMTQR